MVASGRSIAVKSEAEEEPKLDRGIESWDMEV
jgi:hypothetical protein